MFLGSEILSKTASAYCEVWVPILMFSKSIRLLKKVYLRLMTCPQQRLLDWLFRRFFQLFDLHLRVEEFSTGCQSRSSSGFVGTRPGGSCKLLGVLMTFTERYSCNPETLGVLNTTFFLVSRNIGGAIAPPLPLDLLLSILILAPLHKI